MDEKLPETVDEAIQWILERLDLDNQKKLKAMTKRELKGLHFGMAMKLRGSLGLWNPDSPLRNAPEVSGRHPDDISMYLIERLWEYVQGIDLETSDGDEKSP